MLNTTSWYMWPGYVHLLLYVAVDTAVCKMTSCRLDSHNLITGRGICIVSHSPPADKSFHPIGYQDRYIVQLITHLHVVLKLWMHSLSSGFHCRVHYKKGRFTFCHFCSFCLSFMLLNAYCSILIIIWHIKET
jgi:hypothetical protein